MKGFTLFLIGGVSALYFSRPSEALLDGHLKALQEAPSLTATLNVQPIGGAPAQWKLSYSKPNFFRLENESGWTLSDGKTIYHYSKKDNTWSESPASDAAIVKEAGAAEAWGWRAFFDKDVAKSILAAKPGPTRIVKGNQVTEVALTIENLTASLLIDTKLGIARGFTYKKGEIDLIVNTGDIAIGKDPIPAEKFAFVAPEGAKKAEPAAAGASGFTAVQALFERTCMPCHSTGRRSGGFNLSSYAGISRGVVAGNPGGSQIFQAISGTPPRMPQMRAPLGAADVELVRKWIEDGAKQ